MQAYVPTDRYYSSQQPYGQQAGYYQQFPPGYGYGQPGAQPIAAPFPVYPGVHPGTPAPGRPRPLDREVSRSSTPGRHASKPLKSALKRTRTPDPAASVGERPLSRGRSTDTMQRQRTRSGSRMRAGSIPAFVPDHLILTLRSTHLLLLENIRDPDIADELSQEILPIWPHGINTLDNHRGKWRVDFAGTPWACTGLDAVLVGRMIVRMFFVLARLGYTYLSTVNIGNPWKAPQLIFIDSTPDYEAMVFAIMLSKSGDKLTILDGPQELTQQLGIDLRAAFPRRITADRSTEDGLHVFEIRKGNSGTLSVDKSLLIAFILRFFNGAGFKLSGSVPMGTRGFFHFGGRKEIWIFRSDWRPSSRSKEYGRRPSSRQSRGDHDA